MDSLEESLEADEVDDTFIQNCVAQQLQSVLEPFPMVDIADYRLADCVKL